MTDLQSLTAMIGWNEARAVRLGYALGVLHGRDEDRDPDLDPLGPEFRALEGLGLPS